MSNPLGQGAVFSGFRVERQGWIGGLTTVQAAVCLCFGLPVVLLFGVGQRGVAFVLLPIAVVVIAAVAVPVRGRPAVRWVGDAVCHVVGVAMKWSVWQSKASAGVMESPEIPDLPGILTRVEMSPGPVMADQGRVCVLHDTHSGRWGATARISYRGIGLASHAECARFAGGLGELLRKVKEVGLIDRVSIVVRTVPDDGTSYRLYREGHERAEAPAVARTSTAQAAEAVSTRAVRQEAFLTVSAAEEAIRKDGRRAGGGLEGRARVLYRALEGLREPLSAMGAERPTWLGVEGMAEAIHTGYNPSAEPGLRASHDENAPARMRAGAGPSADGGEPGAVGLGLAAAGPTRARAPEARCYQHQAYTTVSYTLAMPGRGFRFGALAPLLNVPEAGERRCVGVHYQVLEAKHAARVAKRERQAATTRREVKGQKGFGAKAEDRDESSSAARQEASVAAGNALVRVGVAAAVTVPADASVEAACARLEASAAGRFPAQRLDLAQPAGFVAAVEPVGIGLPNERRI